MNFRVNTYVIDSLSLKKADEDSIRHRDVYSFDSKKGFDVPVGDTKDINPINNKSTGLGYEGVLRNIGLEQNDTVFILLLLSFLLVSKFLGGGLSYFRENIRILFSPKKSSEFHGETVASEFWVNLILTFQTVLLVAVIVFDYFQESGREPYTNNNILIIFSFMIAISILLGLKYCIYVFLGYLFDIKDYIRILIRDYNIIIVLLGMIALIPVLVMVYSEYFHIELLYFFGFLFLFSRILLFYRVFMFFIKSHVNILYLIAYLCSVEIIPYIILYQELIYLYNVDIISLLWR